MTRIMLCLYFFISMSGFSNPFLNFGVVANDENYQIYRSAELGNDGLERIESILKSKGLPFPKTIIYMNDEGYQGLFPEFSAFAVEEFKAQEKYGFKFYHPFDYNYRTYLDGVNPYEPSEDIDKKDNLNSEAKELFGVIEDEKKDGGIDSLVRILKLVLDKDKQPVLFHCHGGRHRSGIIAMLVRHLQGGKWKTGSKRFVYGHWLSPLEYEYFEYNRLLFKFENIKFVRKFVQSSAFREIQNDYPLVGF